MELMRAAVPGGTTGEKLPYYIYSDLFCFEVFVRWGFLWGCLCTPAKTLPRTWATAKHKDTELLPLCSRVCVLGVFLLPGQSHPPLSWTMESCFSLLVLDWRLYQVMSDQAKNKAFSSDVFSWDIQCSEHLWKRLRGQIILYLTLLLNPSTLE